MDELEAQVRAELQGIIAVLQELTGLPSQWSGRVELVPDAKFKGTKLFSCDVLIHASLAEQDLRWRTLIHEALHSFSVGYVSSDYQEIRGWEEGVVEHLQRLLRPAVLAQMEIAVPEDVFRPVEDAHLFNFYLEALEELRGFFPISAQDFYLRLLHTPLRDRPALLFGMSQDWPVRERAQLVQALSKANAVLKRKINQ